MFKIGTASSNSLCSSKQSSEKYHHSVSMHGKHPIEIRIGQRGSSRMKLSTCARRS
jgi:hypothetical protein